MSHFLSFVHWFVLLMFDATYETSFILLHFLISYFVQPNPLVPSEETLILWPHLFFLGRHTSTFVLESGSLSVHIPVPHLFRTVNVSCFCPVNRSYLSYHLFHVRVFTPRNVLTTLLPFGNFPKFFLSLCKTKCKNFLVGPTTHHLPLFPGYCTITSGLLLQMSAFVWSP